MVFIDVRCPHCNKLLCRVSKDFYGLVQAKCQHQQCKKTSVISLAVILKQMRDEPDTIIPFPQRTSAR
jgi:phage FluMu protein Com